MCGEPFSGKRSDSLYCSNSCKAKYFELRKKGQLPKNSLNGLSYKQSLKSNNSEFSFETQNPDNSKENNKVKSIDQDDLAPFDNLADDGNNSKDVNKSSVYKDFNIGGADSISLFNNNKAELPAKFIKKEISKDNPIYVRNMNRIKDVESDIFKCNVELARLNNALEKVQNDKGNGYLVAGLAGGGILAGLLYKAPTDDKNSGNKKIPKIGRAHV